MSNTKRRVFTREFKVEAVKLITEKGYSIAEASRNLGIDYSVLRRWKIQMKSDSQRLKDRGVSPLSVFYPAASQVKPNIF